VSAQGHLTEIDYLLAVLLAMVLISLLWWVHYADDASLRRVDDVIERSSGVTARTALVAFSFGYLVLVGGLILVAAGLHVAVHDPGHHLTWRVALTMAAGTATYLVGNVFYLDRLGVGGRRWLVVMALAAVATVLVGHQVGGVAQVVVLDLVLLAALVPSVREGASVHAPGDG
jgi:low temperature requirement protein LtrA